MSRLLSFKVDLDVESGRVMETEDVGEVWGVGGRFGGDGGCRLVFGWFLECQIVVHAGEEINFRSSINLVQIQLMH